MAPTTTPRSGKGIDFGLIFFSSSEASFSGERYRLVIESTKFADQHGFSSVWIPERHFTQDGWLYPNPAVLQAALARETSQIQLRAGSVVIPLHNPLRVAEEWAMVDNLSGGRVGISFASGWHPNDFALNPENYARRSQAMYEGIEVVRKLWRGEAVQVLAGDGKPVELRTYPPPLQPELPFWVTAAGNPKTFAGAGEIGANLLTHMYNQSVDELAEKIRIYRDARAQHGYDPATGNVSVMMHTYIGPDAATVNEQLQGPFCDYLKSASYLVNAIGTSRGQHIDLATLSEQDLQDYLLFVFNRMVSTQRVLFGTPESCLDLVMQLQAAGVNEIACQMDFGVDIDLALQSLPYLQALKEQANTKLAELSAMNSPYEATQPHRLNGHALLHDDTTASISPQSSHIYQLDAIRRRCQREVAMPAFYQRLDERGIQLASSFRGVEQLWQGDGEALGAIHMPASLEQERDVYEIHPALLDACLQVLIATLPGALSAQDGALYLPTAIRQFQVHQRPGGRVWSYARLTGNASSSAGVFEGDVRLFDGDGHLVAEINGLQLQRSEPIAQPEPPQHSELDEWLYELQWETVTLPPAGHGQLAGQWLVFVDQQGAGESLIARLQARGATCIRVLPGERYRRVGSGQYEINPARSEDVRRVLQESSVTSAEPLRGVLHLWSLDATPVTSMTVASLQADQINGSGNALSVMQALSEMTDMEPAQLWLFTRGAQPVGEEQAALALAQSPLWGLGKTCAMEHPEFWGGLIDLDPRESINAALVVDVITGNLNEDQWALRQGHAYVARMVRCRALTPQPLQLRQDASYLITGGLWGLGLEVARWLAEKGARHLVLLGRTQLPVRADWELVTPGTRLAQQIAGIRSLEATGAHVHYAAVDVADEQQLTAFFKDFDAQHYPAIRGVVHAASVWQDAQGQSLVRPLANLTADALQTVFRPKVVGSWLLHTQLRERPLDFFVSFSSGASLFGSPGQGNYAAAGEFMDVLAHYQRAQGQPALSIDWGAISEIGFGATPEGLRVHEYWEAHGIRRITPRQVLAALELLQSQQVTRVGVIRLDWQLLQQFYPQITALPLVSHQVGKPADAQAGDSSQDGDTILQKLQQAEANERLQMLQEYLCEQVARVLHIPPAKLDVAQPLTVLGLDSLMAIELKNHLERALTVRIPIVTFLQGPSITQFASQVFQQITEMIDASERLDGQSQSQQAEHLITVVHAQDAEHVLAQLDQLSDQAVDTLLNQMLQEEDGQQEHGLHGNDLLSNGISPQDAEQLLTQLDQLSDEQVDALLAHIAQKEDNR